MSFLFFPHLVGGLNSWRCVSECEAFWRKILSHSWATPAKLSVTFINYSFQALSCCQVFGFETWFPPSIFLRRWVRYHVISNRIILILIYCPVKCLWRCLVCSHSWPWWWHCAVASCWFWPGLAAGTLVLLSRSSPASDPLECVEFSFDVPGQRCDRRNWFPPPWFILLLLQTPAGCLSTSAHHQEKKQSARLLLLPPSPPAVMFVFMFWLGFNFWCLELWRFCFLPSFESECCLKRLERLWRNISFTLVKSQNAADQNLSPASNTGMCFLFVVF